MLIPGGKQSVSDAKKDDNRSLSTKGRREVLRKLGRFAAVSAPAVTLLLAAQTKSAAAFISNCAALSQPSNSKPA